jgi:hypothetical protein
LIFYLKKKIINQKLIENVFEFLISSEGISFTPCDDLKKKIQTSLVSLKRSYERIKRNRFKLAIFFSNCSKECIEFSLKKKSLLKLKDTEHLLEIENRMTYLRIGKSDNIENLFICVFNMCI